MRHKSKSAYRLIEPGPPIVVCRLIPSNIEQHPPGSSDLEYYVDDLPSPEFPWTGVISLAMYLEKPSW